MIDERTGRPPSPAAQRWQSEQGAALVEFALVSFVLYLLLAATVDFGRMMFSAQAVQDVARTAARELAVAPLPADITFDDALQDPAVMSRIYDPACLVVDLDTFADDAAVDSFFAAMPIANRSLRPLMIMDHPGGRNLLRYPGALLSDAAAPSCAFHAPTGLTVGIPRVESRGAGGVETITWVPILEEIRREPGCPARGPFGLVYDAGNDSCAGTPAPLPQRGVVAIRINYPFQAAMMTGFQSPDGPLDPNIGHPITADDDAVSDAAPPGGLIDDPDSVGPYAGRFGLGRQLAFASTVRPFRKLIAGQAIFRREVFN